MSLQWIGMTAEEFATELDDSAGSTRRESKIVMRQGARDIMEDSKKMAPVDEGNLEEAHHIVNVTLNANDMEIVIEVGGTVNGVDVDEYAELMNDPVVPYRLGIKSEAKDAGNPAELRVGPHFLDRAAELHTDAIALELAATLPFGGS